MARYHVDTAPWPQTYVPPQGYEEIMAICPHCLRIWFDLSIRRCPQPTPSDLDADCQFVKEALIEEGCCLCPCCRAKIRLLRFRPAVYTPCNHK